VADYNRLHTIGNGGLPCIVFTHSLISASLVQRDAIAMLLTYRLPTKRAKGLTYGYVTGDTQRSAPEFRAIQA
jgi:hypothetical protein